MENKEMTLKELLEFFDKEIEEGIKLDYYVRNKNLQQERIKRIKNLVLKIHKYKENCKKKNEEQLANTFFLYQCVFNALISSLTMWIELKDNEPYKAWDKLIDAQEYISYALKVEPENETLILLQEKYKNIETSVFPGFPLYNSCGFILKGGICSICGKPLEQCEHIEGKLYYGSICKRIKVEEIDIDHTAMVPNPKDKRCVIHKFEFEPGKMYDYMTLEFLENKKKPEEGTLGTMEMVLFNANELDIF